MSALEMETSESEAGGDPSGVLFNLAFKSRFLRKRMTSRMAKAMAMMTLRGKMTATALSVLELVEKLV